MLPCFLSSGWASKRGDLLGGGFHFAGRIVRWLLVGRGLCRSVCRRLCRSLAVARLLVRAAFGQFEHRRRLADGAADDAGKPRRKLAVGAVVHGDQQTLEIGHEAARVDFFAFEPDPFVFAHRHATERPAQHRRHRNGRDDRHGDDQRKQILAEHAHRQADRGDDHFGRTAGIHGRGQRQRLRCRPGRRACRR